MALKDLSIAQLVGCRVLSKTAIDNSLRVPLLPELFTGIEIEAEGVEWDRYGGDEALQHAGWTTHYDGSLRDDGVEWVLRQPSCGQELSAAITAFGREIDGNSLTYNNSPRAGTHIHINMSDRKMGHVQALTALVYAIEHQLFTYAGEDRRWCSYCNSLNTLPASTLRQLLVPREGMGFAWYEVWPNSENDRYYGFNVTALAKFGTLEFRYFPSPLHGNQLWKWVDLCHALYKYAERWCDEDNPAEAVLFRILNETEEFVDDLRTTDGLKVLATTDEDIAIIKEAAEELLTIISFEHVSPSAVPQPGAQINTLIDLMRYVETNTAGPSFLGTDTQWSTDSDHEADSTSPITNAGDFR